MSLRDKKVTTIRLFQYLFGDVEGLESMVESLAHEGRSLTELVTLTYLALFDNLELRWYPVRDFEDLKVRDWMNLEILKATALASALIHLFVVEEIKRVRVRAVPIYISPASERELIQTMCKLYMQAYERLKLEEGSARQISLEIHKGFNPFWFAYRFIIIPRMAYYIGRILSLAERGEKTPYDEFFSMEPVQRKATFFSLKGLIAFYRRWREKL